LHGKQIAEKSPRTKKLPKLISYMKRKKKSPPYLLKGQKHKTNTPMKRPKHLFKKTTSYQSKGHNNNFDVKDNNTQKIF
jgi:hypothetical protein